MIVERFFRRLKGILWEKKKGVVSISFYVRVKGKDGRKELEGKD